MFFYENIRKQSAFESISKQVPSEIILQALNIFGRIKSILLECLLFTYLNKSLKLIPLIWAVLHDVKIQYDKKLCNT